MMYFRISEPVAQMKPEYSSDLKSKLPPSTGNKPNGAPRLFLQDRMFGEENHRALDEKRWPVAVSIWLPSDNNDSIY